MPLYRYECGRCGHVMEVLEKSAADARHKCEKCGGIMEKMMPGFSVGSVSGSGGGSCPTGTCSLS
jgi:putative FmdB family regulatory protein